MAAHLNINSLRYKFDEIKEVLTDNIVDLLIISETKLDESFNDNLFSVDGYKDQLSDDVDKRWY
jgi:exonuclease III